MIPKNHLYDLGFEEVKDKLFIRHMEDGAELFADYTGGCRVLYAYRNNQRVNPGTYKQAIALIKIESSLLPTTLEDIK